MHKFTGLVGAIFYNDNLPRFSFYLDKNTWDSLFGAYNSRNGHYTFFRVKVRDSALIRELYGN